MRIVLSTFNHNKFLELNATSIKYGIKLSMPSEIKIEYRLSEFRETDEIGTSYKENALLKAKECSSWCNLPSLGDDSGLEVDALNGGPGLHSKRYADTDEARIAKLIHELKGKKNSDRSCRFRSVLAFHDPSSQITICGEGILEGEVLEKPQGNGGFGYDPIILIHKLGCTLAEIDQETLFNQGFRSIAARALFANLNLKNPSEDNRRKF